MNFVDLYQKNFPQLTLEEAQSLHSNFKEYGVHAKWFFSTNLSREGITAQGDVFDGLIASYYDYDEDRQETSLMTIYPCNALVITNTCDNELDRAHCSVFVPLFNAKEYFEKLADKNREDSIKKNVVTSLLFLPENGDEMATVADLSILSSVSQSWQSKMRSKGLIRKKASLTISGYYFLLAKLTLHLMRPESHDMSRNNQ